MSTDALVSALSCLATAAALIGTVLNAHMQRVCFLFWMFSNAWWFEYNLWHGQTVLAIQFWIFFVLAVYGWFEWKK